MAAGVLDEDEGATREGVERRFASFEIVAIDLRTGEEDPAFDSGGQLRGHAWFACASEPLVDLVQGRLVLLFGFGQRVNLAQLRTARLERTSALRRSFRARAAGA